MTNLQKISEQHEALLEVAVKAYRFIHGDDKGTGLLDDALRELYKTGITEDDLCSYIDDFEAGG